MKADLSRFTFNADKHYRTVRMQQGRVQTDADWNEQQDILNHRVETGTGDLVGPSGGPIDTAGFGLTGSGKNIAISAGHYYVDGLLCENGLAVTVTSQPDLPAQASPVLPAGAALLPLPPAGATAQSHIVVYTNGVAGNPPDGIYIGYLEVWQRHLTALEDELIREVALGGPDTATREKTLWQVKLLRAADLAVNLTCLSQMQAWTDLITAPDGTLAARAEPSTPPKDPCLLAPEAGFRRLENLLYRVEIHDDGILSNKVRFKWSHDNGCIVTRVTRWLGNPLADEFEVATIGRDAYLSIREGCWLEFFDDTHELLGQPGVLVKVLKTAGNLVTLDLTTKTGPLDQALFTQNPRVRRWDGWGDLAPAAPNSATGWVDLEDGVQIKFKPGHYRVGDYWMIPARTATADVEWPQINTKPAFLAPRGILRAFARLALLRCQAGVWTTLSDCRSLFPALTELTNLFYVGGDGQEAMPNPLNPQVVPLSSPLEVAVFNGQFPVVGAQVRFSVSHGQLPNGTATQVVTTLADGLAAISWSVAPGQLNQTATAELLEAGLAAGAKFDKIHFSARLALASQLSYDPAKCLELSSQGVHTVQDAIDALCRRSHGGGCCISVGDGGEFATLDKAIRTLLEKGRLDICLCLLPGSHHFEDALEVQAPPGVHLTVHGTGRASRLILRGEAFNLLDFDSVALSDFDLHGQDKQVCLRLSGCAQVSLANLQISGFTLPGTSLVTIAEAHSVAIRGSVLRALLEDNFKKAKAFLAKTPVFEPLQAGLQGNSGALLAPLERETVQKFAALSAAQRREAAKQTDALLRAVEKAETNCPLLIEALLALRENLSNAAGSRHLSAALEGLRQALFTVTPGFALALGDAGAVTLVSDTVIDGRLSLYGEATKNSDLPQELLKALAELLRKGAVSLLPGRGALRLHNNRLREIRLSDDLLQLLAQLVEKSQGSVPDCYRSLIASENELVGATSQLLAFDLGLSRNVLRPLDDVAVAIALQANYLGNFIHKDNRLLNLGNDSSLQRFANGALNVVDL